MKKARKTGDINQHFPTLEIINDRFIRLSQVSLSNEACTSLELTEKTCQCLKFSEYMGSIAKAFHCCLLRFHPWESEGIMMIDQCPSIGQIPVRGRRNASLLLT